MKKGNLLIAMTFTCLGVTLASVGRAVAVDYETFPQRRAIATHNHKLVSSGSGQHWKGQSDSPHSHENESDGNNSGSDHSSTPGHSDEPGHGADHHNEHGAGHHDGHGEASHGADAHHGSLAVADPEQVPSLTIVVVPDTHHGWNVEVQTEHFTFAPERVNQANQQNEGHAHLYVDGSKIARLYGNWYHIDHLEPGTREITVSLHANGHEVWTYDGEAIAETVTVEVSADEL